MYFFFPAFSPASLTELFSFRYGLKDLFPLIHVLDRSKNDDVTSSRRDVDSRGRVRAVQGRMK